MIPFYAFNFQKVPSRVPSSPGAVARPGPRSNLRTGRAGGPAALLKVEFVDEASFIKHISRFDEWGESLEVKERLLSRRLAFTVQKYRVVNLGEHVQLREGGWFLARPSVLLPSEASAMWFGKVEAIFQHKGPDSEERLMLQVCFTLFDGWEGREGLFWSLLMDACASFDR